MKATINKRIMLFYSLLGTVLFILSGVFIIQSWERAFRTRTRDLAMTKGVVSIINGVIFFMDTIFTFRQKKQPLINEPSDQDYLEEDTRNIHKFAFKITFLKTMDETIVTKEKNYSERSKL